MVGRKRPKGRPPSIAVAVKRAAKDPRQGKLNLAIGDITGLGIATGAPGYDCGGNSNYRTSKSYSPNRLCIICSYNLGYITDII